MKCKIIAISRRVEKLEILVSREAAYQILNLSHIFEYQSWYWWSCQRFQGCSLENGEEYYYYICRFKFDYFVNEMFKIRNSKKNIQTSLSMKKDLSGIKKIDLTIDEFWDYNFKFTW